MCRDTLKAEKNKTINEITLLWGVPTESMYTSWRFFTSYTWQNEGCVRRTWYINMHDKQHQRATCVFCVCVFKLYSVNIKQHSWYILLPCQEPVLSYPLLCFYAPKPAVDPQHIQTDIQSPCITWSLVTKPKPVLNRIVNSTPQAIHLNRFIERGIATWESINLSMFVRIFLHIPHKLHWFLQL